MKFLKKARSLSYILGILLLLVGVLPLTAVTNIGTVYAEDPPPTCPPGQTPNADGLCVCPDGTYAATDGTCKDVPPPVVPSDPKYGCTDPSAFNYNATATIDDGSCVAHCPTNASLAANDPACVPAPVYGCTDAFAFNFNSAADTDDGSCVAVCAINASLPANDPTCRPPEVFGCTTPGMFNFDPDANVDDPNNPCVAVCQWNTALAANDTGCVAPADACGKDFPCGGNPAAQPGWSDGDIINEDLSCAASFGGWCTDARVKIITNGIPTTYEAECGEPNKTIGTGSHNVELFDPYDAVITGYYGGSSFIDNLLIAVNVATRDGWDDLTERNVYWSILGKTPTINNPISDAQKADQAAKAASITSGANDVVLKNVGVYFLGVVGDPSFTKQLMFLKYCATNVLGCTDPNSLNYNPAANTDDGTCIARVHGCTDPNALNYDPRANTNDDSCVDKVHGCMDPSASNYNPAANVAAACEYPPAPPNNPPTTTRTTTTTIPVTGEPTDELIIPVTGVDLGEQLQSFAKYLGLLVIGMTLILEGFTKKQRK